MTKSKIIKPNSKNKIEIAGSLIVKGVCAVQYKSGTLFRDKMFIIFIIRKHVLLNGFFVDHQFLDLSRWKVSVMHAGYVLYFFDVLLYTNDSLFTAAQNYPAVNLPIQP